MWTPDLAMLFTGSTATIDLDFAQAQLLGPVVDIELKVSTAKVKIGIGSTSRCEPTDYGVPEDSLSSTSPMCRWVRSDNHQRTWVHDVDEPARSPEFEITDHWSLSTLDDLSLQMCGGTGIEAAVAVSSHVCAQSFCIACNRVANNVALIVGESVPGRRCVRAPLWRRPPPRR